MGRPSKGERVGFALKMAPALMERAKAWAAKSGLTLNDAINAVIESAVSGEPIAAKPAPVVSPRIMTIDLGLDETVDMLARAAKAKKWDASEYVVQLIERHLTELYGDPFEPEDDAPPAARVAEAKNALAIAEQRAAHLAKPRLRPVHNPALAKSEPDWLSDVMENVQLGPVERPRGSMLKGQPTAPGRRR